MSKKLSSILDDLVSSPTKNKDSLIENRAIQVVASYNNLMELIENTYDDETATDLQKRLLLSIKNQDDIRFTRKIQEIKKSKNGNI